MASVLALLCILVLIATSASASYEETQYYVGNGCGGSPSSMAAISSTACVSVGCVSALGLAVQVTCPSFPSYSGYAYITATYSGTTCTGAPTTISGYGSGCLQNYVSGYTKATCNPSTGYTFQTFSDSACTASTSAMLNGTVGCFSGVSYACGSASSLTVSVAALFSVIASVAFLMI